MTIDITLREFLEWTKGSYKSIDVRCAAAKVDDHWQNGYTVVRFSYRGKTEVEKEHQELRNRCGDVDTSKFKVLLTAFDIDEVELVSEAFNKGKYPAFPATSIEVALDQAIDFMSLKDQFPHLPHYAREREEWKTFEVTIGKHLSNLYEDKDIRESLSSIGFDSKAEGKEAYEVIREFLEVDYQPGWPSVLIIAPLYARLEREMKIEGSYCQFKVVFHRYFDRSLEVNAIIRENTRLKYKEGPLPLSVGESEQIDEDLRRWVKQIQVPDLTERDSIQISLWSRSPRLRIGSIEDKVRDPVALKGAEPGQNPLLSALRRFYLGKEGIEIKGYLAEKEGHKPQHEFEQKIARLLNLCGYSVAIIGHINQLDILKDATEPKTDCGKTDILAYSERINKLLLAECTKEMASSGDAIKVNTAAMILQHELFEGTSIQVIPVVFTDVPQLGTKAMEGVRIINRRDIESIWSDVLQWRDVNEITVKYFLPLSSSAAVI